ncbi:MAG TPA: hypothetical protein PL033_09475 [Candidatus Brocadiia bacterium]|nr:hypothetical protein [Candidatus Brocadiia bacterium]
MPTGINRRSFVKGALLASAAGALNLRADEAKAPAEPKPGLFPAPEGDGNIGNLWVSRLLLGGNLLTHYTHSRDLAYVYKLAEHYNTEAKILETLALAEQHGVNTLSVHTVPAILATLQKHRKLGGKMQWIICPTTPVDAPGDGFANQVKELADMGCDAVYLWGVHADKLVGRAELIAKAVRIIKDHKLPAGVGAHDLRVVTECEKNKVDNDFYIKTFHHHHYPSAPRPDQVVNPYNEVPGYWCSDPNAVIETMKNVQKPWIAFKVMAAGAIPPQSAFQYAFDSGADHVLAGMFDFEIAADADIVKSVLGSVKRTRPWHS